MLRVDKQARGGKYVITFEFALGSPRHGCDSIRPSHVIKCNLLPSKAGLCSCVS